MQPNTQKPASSGNPRFPHSTHGRAGKVWCRPIRRSASPDPEGIAGGWRTTRGLGTLKAARDISKNLERQHLLAPETHLDYFAGLALDSLGRAEERTRGGKKPVRLRRDSRTWLTTGPCAQDVDRESEAVSVLEELLDFRVAPTRCGSQNRYLQRPCQTFCSSMMTCRNETGPSACS